MSTIPEFPLHWPDGMPRSVTKASSRFDTTLSKALGNVVKSLDLFGRDASKPVKDISISTNFTLGRQSPADCGVAVWFEWDGQQRCIAVDRYPKVADNLQAIHHVLEARRTELRHGGLNIVRQTFRGFTALPAPPGRESWFKVLGLDRPTLSADDITAAYRRAAAKSHPDKLGGSHDKMAALNAARDEGLRMAKDLA